MKKVFLFLLLTVIVFAATSCNNGDTGSQQSDLSQTMTEESLDTATDSSLPKNSGDLAFDFDEAIQNIYLFGQKISLPCKFEEFGADFTLNEEILVSQGTSNLTIPLLYKGETIGSVILQDCGKEDENKVSKQVICLTLGDNVGNISERSGWYGDVIPFDFSGISFNSTAEKVKRILCIPVPKETAYFENRLVYEYSGGEKFIWINFSEDKPVEIVININ